jgi:HIV Tat-specific factor 1
MQSEKNLVEEALIQMKQIEDVLSESAKGILSSTMKEEINELVKESLNEQEDEDEMDIDMDSEDDMEMDIDSEDDMEMDMDDEDDYEMEDEDDYEMEDEDDMEMDDDVIDMRGASQSELLKVFKAMDGDDGIIISKNGEDISLTDEDSDSEYLIKLGEQIEKFGSDMDDEYMEGDYVEEDYDMELDEEDDMELDEDDHMEGDYVEEDYDMELDEDDTQSTIDKIFENKDEIIYEIEMDEQEEFDMEDEMDVDMEDDMEMGMEDEMDVDMEDDMEMGMEDEEDFDCSNFSTASYLEKNPKATISDVYSYLQEMGCLGGGNDTIGENYNYLGEGKKGPKFKYKMPTKGFDEKKKEGPKKVGTGKPKFQYDTNAENTNGKMKTVTGKRKETKEASRTYAMGSKEGRGLRKGVTPNRNLHLEALENQVIDLKQKNNDYKKSLNIFREKLTEVAVFNANLAYATRLFTEHSTTKKEKINILRRFDDVQSLQESKNLYSSIKNELSKGVEPTINESVNRKITNVASTGSSANLIESKTYENPQFLRMKDLISKLG